MSDYDVVVVGSGPGGATVARGLSRNGKNVLLLEKGRAHTNLGTYTGAFQMLDKGGFLKSIEGVSMLKASTTGGATVLYSGSAAMPPAWLNDSYGIDLTSDAQETWEELNVGVLPDDLLGDASTHIMESANRIGYHWEKSPKIMNTDILRQGNGCGALTSLGCTCGAKWTARDYIDQAVAAGTELWTSSECSNVITENGRVKGVTVNRGGESLTVYADTVVLSGGGIPSPVLLQKAGIEGAGEGCVIDPTMLVYGVLPDKGTSSDPLVSVVSWEFYDEGIRLGTLMDPKLMTLFSMAKKGVGKMLKVLSYNRMVGILVKVKDELGGKVYMNGQVSKALTGPDLDKLRKGSEIAGEILIASGCDQSSVMTGEIRGAHPSGTCRIGDVVNDNLETEIKNLYVCDASVFPEALDRPTVITIIAFGKRLVRHILNGNSTV